MGLESIDLDIEEQDDWGYGQAKNLVMGMEMDKGTRQDVEILEVQEQNKASKGKHCSLRKASEAVAEAAEVVVGHTAL